MGTLVIIGSMLLRVYPDATGVAGCKAQVHGIHSMSWGMDVHQQDMPADRQLSLLRSLLQIAYSPKAIGQELKVHQHLVNILHEPSSCDGPQKQYHAV